MTTVPAEVQAPPTAKEIFDSGPSGRRGFDGVEVLNIRAEGYGHSDVLAIDKKVDGLSHLEHSYRRYWRPFLTLPQQELNTVPDRVDPAAPWQPLPWLLRGTLLPLVALPLAIALLACLVAFVGVAIAKAVVPISSVLRWSGIGLAGLVL